MRRLLSRLARRRDGSTAMEFAMIAPVMVVVMMSVYDLGALLQQYIRLHNAVRVGGAFAMSWSDPPVNIANQVTAAVSPWNDVTVPTPTMACYCWNSSTQVQSALSCPSDDSLDSCTGGLIFQRFFTITATRSYTPIFLPGPMTTTANYVVQIK